LPAAFADINIAKGRSVYSLSGKANIKHRCAYLETAALAVAAVALSVTTAFSPHLDLLNAIYPSGAWAKRCEILRCLLAIYGAGIAIAAAGSFIMIRYRRSSLSAHCFSCVRSVLQELRATRQWFLTTGQMRHASSWLALIIVIGAAVRSFFLAQSMQYDEAYTFLNFVNGGISSHFFYPLPNNHVLHTLLVRMSVELLGSHPVAIRLPAVLAGLLAIPLTFCLSRSVNGNSRSGFFAAALVAVFPYLILYDTMARGYSLVVLLSLCLVGLGLRVIEHPSIRLCSLMALVIALGVLNMPSFLFPTAGVFCWISMMLVQRGRKPVWVLAHVLTPCALMAVALTGLFYTPVAIASNGIDSVINNRFVKSLPWEEFLNRLPVHISVTARRFLRDIPTPIRFVFLVLLVVGFYATARERRWSTFMLLPAVAIGGAGILFAYHAIPYDRTWIYLLPLIFVLMDTGLAAVAKCSAVYIKRVSLLLAGCAAVLIMNRNMISSYADFPEAPALVDVLSGEMTPADRLVVQFPANAPMHFYMWYRNVPRERSPAQGAVVGREFFVVKPSRYSLADMTKGDVRKLLKIGDAELYVAGSGER
jgi:Dolichyl-phosphate-mannose-protein mannosyltransferase